VLAKHYGFTDEELDYIPSTSLRAGINYDTCLPAGRSSTARARMLARKWIESVHHRETGLVRLDAKGVGCENGGRCN
jgi:hypothetical protein